MAVQAPEVLATFHGDETFPIEWERGEAELFWVLDDLHCPNPLSPLFFDLGGWWLTCDHMFRRFATPFAADWVAKNVNGYLYTAAIPADPSRAAGGERVPGALRAPRPARPRVRRRRWARTSASSCRTTPATSSTGGVTGCAPRSSGTSPTWTATTPRTRRSSSSPCCFEDALDVHDRHWKIHWMLNFAQFSATMALNATIAEVKGEVDPALARPPAELGRGPELGLDRGALADEGGDQGRRRAAATPSGARPPPTCSARSRAPSAAAASSTSA